MKRWVKFCKIPLLACALALVTGLTLAACGSKNSRSDSTFHDADIPDVLRMTVGACGSNIYRSSGITDNQDYDTVLCVTFNGTTEADYTALVEHYSSSATGTDGEGALLFDWGRIEVKAREDSIAVDAYIKR